MDHGVIGSCWRNGTFGDRVAMMETDCQGGFWVGGPCTALSPGLKCGGLESKFGWGLGPLVRRVVGWSCLCLGYKRDVCFEVPSWAH